MENLCKNCGSNTRNKVYCSVTCRREDNTLIKRFWRKVDAGEGCWVWNGAMDKAGYGKILKEPGKNQAYFFAHRLSYQIHYGEFNNEFHVCHKCDNPSCVNPEHLFLGTHQDNMDDMVRKGRGKGKALFGEQILWSKLTDEKVETIINSYNSGEKVSVLSKRHGVSINNIYSILKGELWSHIDKKANYIPGRDYKKITESDVRQIRKIKEETNKTMTQIAKEFGISLSSVSKIVKFQYWKGV